MKIADFFKEDDTSKIYYDIAVHWIGQINLIEKNKSKDYYVNVHCESLKEPKRNYSSPFLRKLKLNSKFLCYLKIDQVFTKDGNTKKIENIDQVTSVIKIINPTFHKPKMFCDIIKRKDINFYMDDYFDRTPCIHLDTISFKHLEGHKSENFILPCHVIAQYYFFKSTELTKAILGGTYWPNLYRIIDHPSNDNDNLARINFQQGLKQEDYKVLSKTALIREYHSALSYIYFSLFYFINNPPKDEDKKFIPYNYFKTHFPYKYPIRIKVSGIYLDERREFFLVTEIKDSDEYDPEATILAKYFFDRSSYRDGTQKPKLTSGTKPEKVPEEDAKDLPVTGDEPFDNLSKEIDQIISNNEEKKFYKSNFEIVFPKKNQQEFIWITKKKIIPVNPKKSSISDEGENGNNNFRSNIFMQDGQLPWSEFNYFFLVVEGLKDFGWNLNFVIYSKDVIGDLKYSSTRYISKVNSFSYVAIAQVDPIGQNGWLYLFEFYNFDNHYLLTLFDPEFNKFDYTTINAIYVLAVSNKFNWLNVVKENKGKKWSYANTQHRKNKTITKNSEFLSDKLFELINNK
jgi:hypothetical protein